VASSLLTGRRVLIVEDEMLVSMLLEDMLGDFGCAIVGPAPNLKEALALAQNEQIDAALLDVSISGDFSFPVADALKARGVPFAFASGYGDNALNEAHRGALVLHKPFRQADLERALTGLMR
jgi:CheY-like chemotaxis protein